MRLRITQEFNSEGVAFGVPRVEDAATGEPLEGVVMVSYYAYADTFPRVEIELAAGIHQVEVVAYPETITTEEPPEGADPEAET